MVVIIDVHVGIIGVDVGIIDLHVGIINVHVVKLSFGVCNIVRYEVKQPRLLRE